MARPATNSRQRFLEATQTLLRQGGLSAAAVNDVVSASQAPKGSFYHYFPAGKTQLVAEALLLYRDVVADYLNEELGSSAHLNARIENLFKRVAARMAVSDFRESCAVGAVVLDLSSQDEELRGLCNNILESWVESAATLLHELSPAARKPAATHLVQLLEGAQLTARACGNARPLKQAAAAFSIYLASFTEMSA
jgi:TetR/AcrR family transcriptional regulator, lmrAB and yxaGH operons repressor